MIDAVYEPENINDVSKSEIAVLGILNNLAPLPLNEPDDNSTPLPVMNIEPVN